jgi:hypothetical protein
MRIFLNAINNLLILRSGRSPRLEGRRLRLQPFGSRIGPHASFDRPPVLDATNRLTNAELPHDASALGCLGTIGRGGAGIHARGNLRFSGAIGSVATLLVD